MDDEREVIKAIEQGMSLLEHWAEGRCDVENTEKPLSSLYICVGCGKIVCDSHKVEVPREWVSESISPIVRGIVDLLEYKNQNRWYWVEYYADLRRMIQGRPETPGSRAWNFRIKIRDKAGFARDVPIYDVLSINSYNWDRLGDEVVLCSACAGKVEERKRIEAEGEIIETARLMAKDITRKELEDELAEEKRRKEESQMDAQQIIETARLMAKDITRRELEDKAYVEKKLEEVRRLINRGSYRSATDTLVKWRRERKDLFDKEAQTLLRKARSLERKEREKKKREGGAKIDEAKALIASGRYDQAEEVLKKIPWHLREVWPDRDRLIEEAYADINRRRKEEVWLRVVLGALIGGLLGPPIWSIFGAKWGESYPLIMLIDALGGGFAAWYFTTPLDYSFYRDALVKLRNTSSAQRFAVFGLLGLGGGSLGIPLLCVFLLVILVSCSVKACFAGW